MKTFEDLEFKSHPMDDNGKQAKMEFDNGYAISVVNFKIGNTICSYTSSTSDYEVAVLKDDALCYDTPITDDVLGYQSEEDVTKVMKQIQEL